MGLSLRLATSADADAIAGLVNLAYRVEDFFKIGDRTDAAEIRELLGHESFILAEDGETLVGCIEVDVQGDLGYFGMLSTQPKRQGEGIGRTLIEAAERRCLEAGCTTMELVLVNLRTELPPFYERFGYRISGTRPFSMPERSRMECHFIVMSKPLIAAAAPHTMEATG